MAEHTLFNADVALKQFKERKAENDKEEKIDNSRLRAGSPMYYYCKHCGEHTETLSEGHWRTPKTVCDACRALVDHGLPPLREKA